MPTETPILKWVNAESGNEEYKQRVILTQKLMTSLIECDIAPHYAGKIAADFAHAIAEYVVFGIAGNTFKRETGQ